MSVEDNKIILSKAYDNVSKYIMLYNTFSTITHNTAHGIVNIYMRSLPVFCSGWHATGFEHHRDVLLTRTHCETQQTG